MKRFSIKLMGLLSLLWMVTSCIKEAYVEPEPVADAEMTLTLSFDTGTRASRVGDPGTDHGENTADWKNLGVYLVYKDGDMKGRILSFTFTKETFLSPKIFNVYPGVADIFVVALPEGQDLPEYPTADGICNMKTRNVGTDASDLPQGIDKNAYMRNIFSGVTSGVIFEKDGNKTTTVTCKRIVSKVDVQYDVQNGIENGKFVEAGMSAISFNGVPQAYIFPGQKTETIALPGVTSLMELSGTISERNGRAYAYMFPGAANMTFEVDYTTEGQSAPPVSYTATFTNGITALTWYKVNFTVSGKNVGASENVTVTLPTTVSN